MVMKPEFGFPPQVKEVSWEGQDVVVLIFFVVRERDVKVRVVIRFRLREGILVVSVGGLSPVVGGLSPGVEEHRGSMIELVSFVVAVFGAESLVVDVLALVLVFVLEEGSSFAGGIDVVQVLVFVLAGSPEGEVLLRRHGVLREWRSVGGRRQHRVSSVGSVVPEVDGLAHRLAVLLEVLGLVYAVVPPTRVVVAVVPPRALLREVNPPRPEERPREVWLRGSPPPRRLPL